MSETKVQWHPYPKEKPEFHEPVLVTLRYRGGDKVVSTDMLHRRAPSSKRKERWGYDGSGKKVIAWAEFPNPYQEGAENE